MAVVSEVCLFVTDTTLNSKCVCVCVFRMKVQQLGVQVEELERQQSENLELRQVNYCINMKQLN